MVASASGRLPRWAGVGAMNSNADTDARAPASGPLALSVGGSAATVLCGSSRDITASRTGAMLIFRCHYPALTRVRCFRPGDHRRRWSIHDMQAGDTCAWNGSPVPCHYEPRPHPPSAKPAHRQSRQMTAASATGAFSARKSDTDRTVLVHRAATTANTDGVSIRDLDSRSA